LGLFILTAVAVVCVGVFWIGRQQMDFRSTYKVRSEFKTVAGLNEGADVRVGGIHKGNVRSIRLPESPDGLISVMMDLSKDTQAIVKKDSVASIQSEGLLGDKYVEVSFGSTEADRLKSGDTIHGAPPFDVSDLFQKANKILDTSQMALEGIRGVTDNLNSITAKVDSGQGTVGKLINDKTLYEQAASGVTSLNEDATALKHNFLLKGFFKDRGYANPEEIKKNEIAQLPTQTVSKQFDFDTKNLFDKADSAKLKNHKLLDPAGQFLQDHPFEMAVVVAATGMKGDSDQQRFLTQARSFAVRKYLVDHYKVNDVHIKVIGLGKTENASADGSLQLMVYGEGQAAPASAASAEPARK
jgi:phospholipid/cholesterol/gamma-HCH transport system substrate-binding protein